MALPCERAASAPRPEGPAMGRTEFRIERIPVSAGEPRLLPLLERLSELGREGWHVAGIDLAGHAAEDREPLTVLLEREVGSKHPPSRQ
jgi:hypothetical protein